MPESQNIEYKSSWHDDYLKWICGFANAQGGRIYIGKDDNGTVIGVADYKDLLDTIPNKVKNLMGITTEVNHEEEDGGFMVTLFKNRFSAEQLQQLGLNERQIKAVLYVKEKGKITNGEYQAINEVKKTAAAAELQDLTERVILTRVGTTGRAIFYELAK
jgi:predicted HTH transcriptional regulator